MLWSRILFTGTETTKDSTSHFPALPFVLFFPPYSFFVFPLLPSLPLSLFFTSLPFSTSYLHPSLPFPPLPTLSMPFSYLFNPPPSLLFPHSSSTLYPSFILSHLPSSSFLLTLNSYSNFSPLHPHLSSMPHFSISSISFLHPLPFLLFLFLPSPSSLPLLLPPLFSRPLSLPPSISFLLLTSLLSFLPAFLKLFPCLCLFCLFKVLYSNPKWTQTS